MEINKQILRKEMTHLRNKLSENHIQHCSHLIFEQIRKHDIYQSVSYVFSYVSFRSEVDTWDFNQQVLDDGKILAVPKTFDHGRMEFFMIKDMHQLKKGPMGIFEPDQTCEPIQTDELKSLMILPGLAFDHTYGRLGYGGGYYDRYLAKSSFEFFKCAVAFDCQLTSNVPRDLHDFLMDYIVTENEWLERKDVI